MKRNPGISILVFLLGLVIVLSGCNSSYAWVVDEKNKQITMTRNDREIKFKIVEHISESYQVLSFDLARDRIKVDNGVTATFWGIPSHLVPAHEPFTRSDINQADVFYLIPADATVHEELRYLAKKKEGCWKEVEITADRVIRIEENGIPSELDLNFFFVREVEGTWE